MKNENRNDWRFQIHWNKLKCINPRSRIEVNNIFCVFYKKLYLKDNNKTAHWIGNSKLKPLDTIDF